MKKNTKKFVLMWLVTLCFCAYVLFCPFYKPYSADLTATLYSADNEAIAIPYEIHVSCRLKYYFIRQDDKFLGTINLLTRESDYFFHSFSTGDFALSSPQIFELSDEKIKLYKVHIFDPQRLLFSSKVSIYVSEDFEYIFILLKNPIYYGTEYVSSVDMPRDEAISFIDSLAEHFS